MQRIQSFLFVLALLARTPQVRAQGFNEAQSVLTQRNDVGRTGVFRHETMLTPSVFSGTGGPPFTRLVIRKVDGQIAAQPLYVSGVTIAGIKRNVLYVATRKNRIYALDADNINQNDPHQGVLWSILLQDWDPPGSKLHPLFASPLSGMDDGLQNPCRQTHGPVGITGTPVIDPGSQIMYLVARFGPTPSQPGYGEAVYHYLVAVDIRTGQELRRVQIQYNGHAGEFIPSAQLNRPGLLLLNNVIYIAFGTPVCDHAEYYLGSSDRPTHGWVFAYSPLPGMNLLDAYNTSPNHGPAGIWQSGSGLAGDPNHNFVYAFTGNSFEDDAIANEEGPGHDLYARSHSDLPESILKLSLANGKFQCDPEYNGCVTDHFTAGNWYRLDTGYADSAKTLPRKLQAICEGVKGPTSPQCNFVGDSDLGSGGPVVLSNGWVVGGGKQGRLYVLDPTDMKHAKQGFLAAINSYHQGTGSTTCITTDPSQEGGCVISTTLADDDSDAFESWGANIHGNPAVWERPSSISFLYLMAEKDYLRAYRISKTGQIVETAEMTTAGSKRPQITPASKRPPYPRGFPNGLRSPDNMPGGFISVSSNGDQDGILWVSISPVRNIETIESGVLMAFDALTLKLLWFDDDPSILFAKYTPITVAGGKVFRATFGDHDDSGVCRLASANNPSCGSIVIYGVRPRLNPPIEKR